MKEAIRFEILGNAGLSTVIGEKFEIEGSNEVFAIHQATYVEIVEHGFMWCATHTETGLRIAKGNDIDGVIANASEAWQSRTPEEIKAAIANGRALRQKAFLESLDISDLCNE